MYTTMEYRCLRCYDGWDVYSWVCRIWGVLTAMVIWGVGIEGVYLQVPVGAFIVFTAVIVTLFESVFVIVFWAEICTKDDSSWCLRFWQAVGWVDDWKKGIFYIVLSIGSFLYPQTFWLGVVSGLMLVICAILYTIKTIKSRREEKEHEIQAKSPTYDRFDADVQEDIEDHTLVRDVEEPEIFSDDQHSLADNVGDQDEILDV